MNGEEVLSCVQVRILTSTLPHLPQLPHSMEEENIDEFLMYLESVGQTDIAQEMRNIPQTRWAAGQQFQPPVAYDASRKITNPFDVPALMHVAATSALSQTEMLQNISGDLNRGESNQVFYRLPSNLILSKV